MQWVRKLSLLSSMGMKLQSALTLVSVNESPLTDHYEFLKVLWEGIYDRSRESAEINAYLAALRNGSMTREQVIASLRERMEFIAPAIHVLTRQ